jgi:hypothetical protein
LTLAVRGAIGNWSSDVTWRICAVARELRGIQATCTIAWITYIASNVIGWRRCLCRDAPWILALWNITTNTG